jgi:hypothetical protein
MIDQQDIAEVDTSQRSWGIWSLNDGDLLTGGLTSADSVRVAIDDLVAGAAADDADETREDLSLAQECDEHEGQPLDGCEDCRDD